MSFLSFLLSALLLLVLGVLILSLAVCFTSYSLFIYEATAAPAGTPPPPKKSLCFAFGLGVLALAATILGMAANPVSPFRRLRRGKDDPRPQAILLHGLYHAPSAWLLFAPALAWAGLGRPLTPAYFSYGDASFEDIAKGLAREIHAVLDACPRIVLVGHSMGGLLIRRLLADPRIARATAAAVTIGAPHHGSKVAALAPCGRSGRQLLPGSPLFAGLAALPDPRPGPRLNILSPADDMVLPTTSCRAPGPEWIEWTSPAVSHISLLYHPRVIRRVIAFLKEHAAPAAQR